MNFFLCVQLIIFIDPMVQKKYKKIVALPHAMKSFYVSEKSVILLPWPNTLQLAPKGYVPGTLGLLGTCPTS